MCAAEADAGVSGAVVELEFSVGLKDGPAGKDEIADVADSFVGQARTEDGDIGATNKAGGFIAVEDSGTESEQWARGCVFDSVIDKEPSFFDFHRGRCGADP